MDTALAIKTRCRRNTSTPANRTKFLPFVRPLRREFCFRQGGTLAGGSSSGGQTDESSALQVAVRLLSFFGLAMFPFSTHAVTSVSTVRHLLKLNNIFDEHRCARAQRKRGLANSCFTLYCTNSNNNVCM